MENLFASIALGISNDTSDEPVTLDYSYVGTIGHLPFVRIIGRVLIPANDSSCSVCRGKIDVVDQVVRVAIQRFGDETAHQLCGFVIGARND